MSDQPTLNVGKADAGARPPGADLCDGCVHVGCRITLLACAGYDPVTGVRTRLDSRTKGSIPVDALAREDAPA